MRRADCAPLVGRRRGPMQLGSWEGIADLRKETAEREGGNRRDLRLRGDVPWQGGAAANGLGVVLLAQLLHRGVVQTVGIDPEGLAQAAQQLGMHPSAMSRRLNRAVTRLKNLAQ